MTLEKEWDLRYSLKLIHFLIVCCASRENDALLDHASSAAESFHNRKDSERERKLSPKSNLLRSYHASLVFAKMQVSSQRCSYVTSSPWATKHWISEEFRYFDSILNSKYLHRAAKQA
jgi:hypothetical protein